MGLGSGFILQETYMANMTLSVNFDGCLIHPDKQHAKRTVLSVHAIIYALNVIESKYEEIEQDLLFLRAKSAGTKSHRDFTIRFESKKVNSVVGKCWELIDWIDRLRKLLGYAAGLKKREDWYKNLVRALESIKHVRHFIQHFDGELNKYVASSFPLMGSIIAFFPANDGVYMEINVSSPTKTPYDNKIVITKNYVFPESITGEINNITFCLESNTINLSNLFLSIQKGKIDLIKYLESEYNFTLPTLKE